MGWQDTLSAAKTANESGDVEKARKLFEQAKAAKSIADMEADAEPQVDETAVALKAIADRLEKIEKQPATVPPVQTEDAVKRAPAHNKTGLGDTETKAWAAFYRHGDSGGIKHLQVGDMEFSIKASNDTTMNITTDADGGYAVPTGHYNGIITRLDEMALYSRLGVQMIPGVGTTVNVPIDNEADGEFVSTAESVAYDRDAPALGTKAMTLGKYTKKIDLTEELMDDEDSRLMQYVERRVGIGLAKTHNSLLVTEVLANGTAGLTLDAAAAIGADEIPELAYKLKEEYAMSAAWLMNRATEGYLRGLQGNDFVFNNRPAGSDRTTPHDIDGFPVYTTSKMTAYGASVKSLVFGDFGYVGLRMGDGMTVIKDPYTRAGNGEILFYYKVRLVYGVLIAEAIQYATHPSA